MQKRLILDSQQLDLTLKRLCQQLIENHGNFEDSVLLGLQPRGIFLAEKIHRHLEQELGKKVQLGTLDSTFHRDDFRRREMPILANATDIPFLLENKKVILIDDVLFTGRSVRAAMDAMITFGRPQKVELLVLIDRKYSRELPIEADYTGRVVNTILSEKVLAEWEKEGLGNDCIWLISKEEK
jgi:pyrimidine operon attenuation protein / uracil phosphoribosyltransferase